MESQASIDARGVKDLRQNAASWIYFVRDPLPWSDDAVSKILGRKALALAKLTRAGLDVPPAFTITSEVYRDYLARGRPLPNELWSEVRSAIARLESATGRQFGRPHNPLTFAVRSGAAESMPGILATFLHCGLSESLAEQAGSEAVWQAFAEFLEGYAPVCLGSLPAKRIAKELAQLSPRLRCQRWLQEWQTSPCGPLPDNPDAILQAAIRAVFDSWQSLEARRFRGRYGWNSEDALSVTVQAMFVADVAGIVFSRNPTRPEANELVVEASAGSGRRLVGGQTTPLRWTVDRDSLTVRNASDRNAADSPAVDSDFVQRRLQPLCRDVLAIELLFNEPVDVEFGCAAGKIVFFQARPLNKPPLTANVEQVRAHERARLVALGAQGRRLWVRHNLAETLPSPTPLSWDLWRTFMTGRGGFGRLYRRMGYRPSRRVCKHGFLELIAGRIYADPQRLNEMLCAGYPFTFDRDALRRDLAALDHAPTGLDLEQLDPWFLVRWPWVVLTLFRARLNRSRLATAAVERFDREIVPRIRTLVETERRVELNRLSLEELIEVFNRRRRIVFDDLAADCFLPGTLGVATWNLLGQRLAKIVRESEHHRTASAMLSAISTSLPDRQQAILQRVARGDTSVDAFLDEFGHRGPGEMDLSSPRWREIPEAVLAWSRRLAGRFVETAAVVEPQPLDEMRHLLQRSVGDRAAKLDNLLQRSIAVLAYRDTGKHEFLRAFELLREVMVELARRTPLGDGVHFLNVAEINDLPQQRDLSQTIAMRRDHHYACMRLYLPQVLEIDDLESFGEPPRVEMGHILPASSLSGGAAAGRVLFLGDSQCPTEPVSERVIVASTIEPACLPLMADAAALVVEQGGILSHVALLARQFAIPAVVVEGITGQLVDGEFILVDADRGLIERREADLAAGGSEIARGVSAGRRASGAPYL